MKHWLAAWMGLGLLLAAPASFAQAEGALAEGEDERFFAIRISEDLENTDWTGTLTSSTFFYGERASGQDPLIGPEIDGIALAAEVDSPRQRLFTDLRGRIDGRHISGSRWDVRADARVRVTPSDETQTGLFGGNEYDVREMFLGRNGDALDLTIGRQFSYELAAVKFDGLELDYESDDHWHYLGFAGLYPTRGSRSIATDYPRSEPSPGVEGSRVLPFTGGAGASYRYDRLYGSFGVVGIYAPYEDRQTNETEKPRVFVTSTGYWRQSAELDVYHFLVADAVGAGGQALTNMTLGLNYNPIFNFRINVQVTHLDTETLNVQAQTRLQDPGVPGGPTVDVVLNNVQVARLSQDEARVSVSGSFAENRFEVSAAGSVRRRPEVVLLRAGDLGMDPPADPILLPAAQAADVQLSVVDRRSFKDIRLGLSYLRAFGLGDQNVNRSEFQVIRLSGEKDDIADGKASAEASFTFVDSSDDNDDMACGSSLQPLACYGTSTARTYTVGLMGTYRLTRDWLGILSTQVGVQDITVENVMQEELPLPKILTVSAFLRLAYRF